MKKLLYSIFLIFIHFAVSAQQIPQVSHFPYDNLRINPGSAGSMDMMCVTGIWRQQMVGFDGNPNIFIGNAEAPFKIGGTSHGAGLSIVTDEIGFNSDFEVQVSYAFRLSVGDGTLGIGIRGGYMEKKLKDAEWIPSSGNPGIDDFIPPDGNSDGNTITMGAGIFYRTEDLYFGVSALNLNAPEITYTGENNQEAIYNLNRHYYVTAGYKLQLTNPAWELQPAVLLKSDGVSTDLDLNLTCVYNKKIWGGVSYRTGEAVVGIVGLELIDGLKVGFSYDVQTTSLMKYSTYEVLLNYCFKIGVEKAPEKYKSIRFL